eukprot:33743-Rhodomonas_salina.1
MSVTVASVAPCKDPRKGEGEREKENVKEKEKERGAPEHARQLIDSHRRSAELAPRGAAGSASRATTRASPV